MEKFNREYVIKILERMKCDPVEIMASLACGSDDIEPDTQLRAAAKLFDAVFEKDESGGNELPLMLNYGKVKEIQDANKQIGTSAGIIDEPAF